MAARGFIQVSFFSFGLVSREILEGDVIRLLTVCDALYQRDERK